MDEKPHEADVTVLIGGESGGIPGSRQFPCSECGRKVWLAPSGQKLVAGGAVPVMCMECGEKDILKADTLAVAVMPDALKEYAIWRKRN
jgi:hypothetical protein